MPEAQDLTIILTLKDRVPFTYRWMRYMNDMRCPYKILIADGGADHTIEEHLRNYANYPHLDYEYIRYPYDTTLDDFYRKLENIVFHVQSDYLLLADNDDFYLIDCIPDILNFMRAHPDYVGARGQLVDLTVYDGNGGSRGIVSGLRYIAVANQAPSLDSSSPIERVDALCENISLYDYYANWYCIFRAAPLQDVWRSLFSLPVKEVIVIELLTHILMLIHGKIGVIPFPFYIRQSNTSMMGATLVIGNEFLERCLINNALADFRLAIDQFTTINNQADRDRLLRAVAVWLEVFVVNLYWERRRISSSHLLRLRQYIRQRPWGVWVAHIYYPLAHFFLPTRKRKTLQIKAIEPYILTRVHL